MTKKRKYQETDNKSRRRSSLLLRWNKNLIVERKLKNRFRKDTLAIDKRAFNLFQSQLHTIGFLDAKEDYEPLTEVCNVDLRYVYSRFVRFMGLSQLLRALIWVYFNQFLATKPPNFFLTTRETVEGQKEEQAVEGEKEEEFMDIPEDIVLDLQEYIDLPEDIFDNMEPVKKVTRFRYHGKYEMRNLFWTLEQRDVAVRTRDYFLNGFDHDASTLICSLPRTQDNEDFIKEFLFGMLKANVDASILCDICCRLSNTDITLLEQTFLPRHLHRRETNPTTNMLKKVTVEASVQRKSLTTFEPIMEEVQAVTTLQRFYRQRLFERKQAVRAIEIWWEPYRLETIEFRQQVRRESREIHLAFVQAHREADLLKWDDLVQEVKEDYGTVLSPTKRTSWYWLQVLAIAIVPVLIAIVASTNIKDMFLDNFLVQLVAMLLYGGGQYLTTYRLDRRWLWVQTVFLLLLTCVAVEILNPFSSTRIILLIVIASIGRKYWLLLLIGVWVVQLVWVSVGGKFVAHPLTFLYDVYAGATMVAASRQGDPVQMLQKVMVNLCVLVIYTAMTVFSIVFYVTLTHDD